MSRILRSDSLRRSYQGSVGEEMKSRIKTIKSPVAIEIEVEPSAILTSTPKQRISSRMAINSKLKSPSTFTTEIETDVNMSLITPQRTPRSNYSRFQSDESEVENSGSVAFALLSKKSKFSKPSGCNVSNSRKSLKRYASPEANLAPSKKLKTCNHNVESKLHKEANYSQNVTDGSSLKHSMEPGNEIQEDLNYVKVKKRTSTSKKKMKQLNKKSSELESGLDGSLTMLESMVEKSSKRKYKKKQLYQEEQNNSQVKIKTSTVKKNTKRTNKNIHELESCIDESLTVLESSVVRSSKISYKKMQFEKCHDKQGKLNNVKVKKRTLTSKKNTKQLNKKKPELESGLDGSLTMLESMVEKSSKRKYKKKQVDQKFHVKQDDQSDLEVQQNTSLSKKQKKHDKNKTEFESHLEESLIVLESSVKGSSKRNYKKRQLQECRVKQKDQSDLEVQQNTSLSKKKNKQKNKMKNGYESCLDESLTMLESTVDASLKIEPDEESEVFSEKNVGTGIFSKRKAALKARIKVHNMSLLIGTSKEKGSRDIDDDDDDNRDKDYMGDEETDVKGEEEDDEDDYDDDDDYGETNRSSKHKEEQKYKCKENMDKDVVINLKKKHQDMNILNNLMPKKEQYCEISSKEGEKYLPINQKVGFKIQLKASDSLKSPFIYLNLFECHKNEDSFTIKVGGPIWSLDWCPTPLSKSTRQCLAVYTHQNPAVSHSTISSQHKDKSIIQLWQFESLSCRMPSNEPNLLALLVIEGGPVWQMKWAPDASSWHCDDQDDSDSQDVAFKSRMGLLACASHSGCVKILSIPLFKQKEQINLKNLNEKTSSQPKFYDVKPSEVLEMSGSNASPCTCLDWNINGKFPIIAAGFADGAIAIWNLDHRSRIASSSSPLNNSNGNKKKIKLSLFPFKSIRGHLSIVSGIVFCPTSEHLFASSSQDKHVKLWNVNDLDSPLLSHRAYNMTCVMWPAVEGSKLFVGFDEGYLYQRNSVAGYELCASKVSHISHTLHNGTIMAMSHNEWLNVMTSCDNAGCLQSCDNILNPPKANSLHRMVLSLVQMSKESNNTGSCICKDSIRNENSESENGQFPILCCCNKDFIIKDFSKNWKFKAAVKSQTELPGDDVLINPHCAIHKVSWNPNKESSDWLAFGGFNGLLRVRLISDVHNLQNKKN